VPVALRRAWLQIEDKAVDYYRQGLSEWYMWWGKTYSNRSVPLVERLQYSSSLEQLGGIAAGVPAIRILDSERTIRAARTGELGVRFMPCCVHRARAGVRACGKSVAAVTLTPPP